MSNSIGQRMTIYQNRHPHRYYLPRHDQPFNAIRDYLTRLAADRARQGVQDWARSAREDYSGWNRAAAQHERMMYGDRGRYFGGDPPPPPGRKSVLFNARKGGYATYQKSMKGKIYRPSTLLYKGVQFDLQESATSSAGRVNYFGHYTHPHRAVIISVCAALAKQLGFMACRDTPTSLQQRFCTNARTAVAGYSIELRYRNEPADTATMLLISTPVTDATSYMGVALVIRDLFYQVFVNTANTQGVYLDTLTLLQYEEIAVAASATKAAPVHLKLADVKVFVDGSSRLKYQNVTLSDAAGTGDTHDVEANPLDGIEYNFQGSKNVLRHTNVGQLQGILTVSGGTGIGYFDSTAFADAEVDVILGSRPNPRVWSSYTKSRSVRLQPGAVSTSFLRKTYEFSVQRWFSLYRRAMQGNAAADTGAAEKTSIGLSRWFALDKMIHDSGDGSTIMNLEVELKMKAVVKISPRRAPTAPYPALT